MRVEAMREKLGEKEEYRYGKEGLAKVEEGRLSHFPPSKETGKVREDVYVRGNCPGKDNRV